MSADTGERYQGHCGPLVLFDQYLCQYSFITNSKLKQNSMTLNDLYRPTFLTKFSLLKFCKYVIKIVYLIFQLL